MDAAKIDFVIVQTLKRSSMLNYVSCYYNRMAMLHRRNSELFGEMYRCLTIIHCIQCMMNTP